jgi:hypothetical protein
MNEHQESMWRQLENGMIVFSPGGLPCIVHDHPTFMFDEVCYQIVDEKWPDGTDILRSMDAYTFCEWFTLEPKKGINELG